MTLEYPQLDRAAREAVAAALEDLAKKVEAMPGGWTAPEDQFGPRQYAWVYRLAVLDLIREEVRRRG